MSFLPERTILGQLEMIEVYSFYDRPVLFSCKNKSGNIFISVWVDSSEDADIWMYAAVSSSRFQEIEQKRVELRDIFTSSEDSFVYQVETPFDDNSHAIVGVLYCNEIPDDYLPRAGRTINSSNRTDDILIEQLAQEKNREIINFVLQFPNQETSEAPIGGLGFVLSSVQEAIDAIGQIKLGKPESHIIQPEVIQKTQVVLSGTFKGSFGMRLEGVVYEEDYLGESLLGQCIGELIALINLGANEIELQAKLSSLKKKAAYKYINFLNSLTNIGISRLHIDWASPNEKTKQSGEIALETIIQTLKVIKNVRLETETTIIVNVKVSSVSFRGKKITLIDTSDNRSYKCVISQSASKDAEAVDSTATYLATIRKYIILTPVVEKEKHEYELLNLKINQEQMISPPKSPTL